MKTNFSIPYTLGTLSHINFPIKNFKSIFALIGLLSIFLSPLLTQAQLYTPIKRINCGGGQVTNAEDGFLYEAEASASNVSFTSSSVLNLSNLQPDLSEPYNTFRYRKRTVGNEFSYTFSNLQSGNHKVVLHFAEPHWGVNNTDWGMRKFGIEINGTQIDDDYNIMTEAALPSTDPLDGARKVATLESLVNVTNGNIVIRFTQLSNDPLVNAIEIYEEIPADIPVTGVDLDLTNASIDIGATQPLSATVSPNDATDPSVSWSSSDTSIATVNSSTGLVTGVAVGTATITATSSDPNVTATANIEVTDPNNPSTGGNWSLSGNNAYRLTGNVGIGTINSVPTNGDPNYKLAVNGSVRAKEIKVETDWADYVFFNDYKLPTLKEVEQHIQDKGHLINIPSAAEVEANGIELGEMNKLLLEKIEELTLYIIQQNKSQEQLEERIKVLEAQK